LDGIEALGDVIVVAATNRRDLIDNAILRAGRFDVELELGPPDAKARKQILAVHTRDLPLEKKVELEELARLTDGLVGSDLAWICRQALRVTLEEYVRKHPDRVQKPPFKLKVKRKSFLHALDLLRARGNATPPAP
jgi:transitional endoplasmic reticulum ATPase